MLKTLSSDEYTHWVAFLHLDEIKEQRCLGDTDQKTNEFIEKVFPQGVVRKPDGRCPAD